MTRFRVTLALMLVMVAVLLAAGCAGQAGDENSAGNASGIVQSTTAPPFNQSSVNYMDAQQKRAAIEPNLQYKTNMTSWQRNYHQIFFRQSILIILE